MITELEFDSGVRGGVAIRRSSIVGCR